MTKLRRGAPWASMLVLDKECVAWGHRGISRSFDQMKYRLSLNDACTACQVDVPVRYVLGLRARSISKSQGHGLEGGSHKTRGPHREPSPTPPRGVHDTIGIPIEAYVTAASVTLASVHRIL